MIKQIIHIVVLCFLYFPGLYAQSKTALIKIIPSNSPAGALVADQFQYRDTLQLVEGINDNLTRLFEEGYLLAGLVSARRQDSVTHVIIKTGDRFEWARLTSGSLPEHILSKVGYRQKVYEKVPFKIRQVNNLFTRVIRYSQNNGYPFAWISLDSVEITDFIIKAAIRYTEGPMITFDSLRIDESLAVKRSWLGAYLGIIPGRPFDQRLVDNIEKKIKKLNFLKLEQAPQVIFENEKAIIILGLKKVPSNKIDGIVGFLPNEKIDGGTLITGQFDMGLTNLFNSGKSLNAHWQSLKPRSQLLELNYLHRNLLHSPLHFSSSFYLLKEDTTFINRKGELSFHYQPSAHDLSFFTRFESSRLISSRADDVLQPGQLSDFNVNYYGLGYAYSKVTDTRVPRGITGNVNLAVGNKSIKNNSNLPPDVLSTIDLKSIQYTVEAMAQWLQPVAKLFGTLVKVSGGKLINDQLFINDLYRVGGLQSLRGFNENFFFAAEYMVGTVEARLYYEQNSFVYLFYDQSYLYYRVRTSRFEDYPLGVGVGLSLQTGNGILNLAYALGKSSEQPLSLSLSKFHFGYVAKF